MEIKKIAVDPEVYARLASARASSIDLITVLQSAKLSAFVEFFPDKNLSSATRNSQGFPALESTVRIVTGGLPVWKEAERFIGTDCTLKAVFMTGDQRMVAVEHQEDLVCCCFRAEMVRTPEQAKAEVRQRDINALADELAGYDDELSTKDRHEALATYLIEQGYGKREQP